MTLVKSGMLPIGPSDQATATPRAAEREQGNLSDALLFDGCPFEYFVALTFCRPIGVH